MPFALGRCPDDVVVLSDGDDVVADARPAVLDEDEDVSEFDVDDDVDDADVYEEDVDVDEDDAVVVPI